MFSPIFIYFLHLTKFHLLTGGHMQKEQTFITIMLGLSAFKGTLVSMTYNKSIHQG